MEEQTQNTQQPNQALKEETVQPQDTEQSQTATISLDSLEPMESESLDLSPFEGKRVTIEKAEVIEVSSQFSETGRQKVLRVESEPVTTVETAEGKKEIRASELFNLIEKDGKVGWSKDERGKLQKFLAKMKATKPTELVGKEAVVRLRSKKNDFGESTFLGFVI